jgi:hypothetical protein
MLPVPHLLSNRISIDRTAATFWTEKGEKKKKKDLDGI